MIIINSRLFSLANKLVMHNPSQLIDFAHFYCLTRGAVNLKFSESIMLCIAMIDGIRELKPEVKKVQQIVSQCWNIRISQKLKRYG